MMNKMDEFYFHLDPREARSRYFTMLNLGLRVQAAGPSGLAYQNDRQNIKNQMDEFVFSHNVFLEISENRLVRSRLKRVACELPL